MAWSNIKLISWKVPVAIMIGGNTESGCLKLMCSFRNCALLKTTDFGTWQIRLRDAGTPELRLVCEGRWHKIEVVLTKERWHTVTRKI